MKKNKLQFLGVIAMAAVIMFSTVGCPTDSGSDKDGDDGTIKEKEDDGEGSGIIGEKLELSGQVYLSEWGEEEDDYTHTYKPFDGDLSISDNGAGGIGEIKGGKFSYSIGKPTGLDAIDQVLQYTPLGGYTNLSVSPNNVQGYIFQTLDITGSTTYSYIYKGDYKFTGDKTSGSKVEETVFYVYVDGDITITGDAETTDYEDEGDTGTWTSNSFNLALKTGWNAVYCKVESSETTGLNATTNGTISISLSNPTLRWVLSESDGS